MTVTDKHKVFISYHHANDQSYKEDLLTLSRRHDLFIDASVDTGDISDLLDDDAIRRKIRDDYLRDSSVTIVLVGSETQSRKHVDWEIYSSMFNGSVNKQSGILVINLPEINCTWFHAGHGDDEKALIYSETSGWMHLTERTEYEKRYPYMPARIIDNLVRGRAKLSVANWNTITSNVNWLRWLIDATFQDRSSADYDLSRPMRRNNS